MMLVRVSRVKRKPVLPYVDVDHAADQCLCFRYIDNTIPLIPECVISRRLASFCVCDCTARFVSNLVGNTEDRICRDAAQIKP